MTAIRPIVLAVMVLVGGVTLAVPVAGSAIAGGGVQEDDGGPDAPPMGSQVSAFMHSSASVVDESVANGMFVAAFENADDETRAELVENRANGLDRKLAELRDERETLRNESDGMTDAQRSARIARLTAQIDALEDAINATEPRASQAGLDTAKFAELRENASNLSGPDVAEIARDLAGVEPPRGPPDDANSDAGRGNEKKNDGRNGASDDDSGTEKSPPERGSGSDRNESDRGEGDGTEASDRGADGDGPPGQDDDPEADEEPGQNGAPVRDGAGDDDPSAADA